MKKKILVVEDNPKDLKILKEKLAGRAYQLVCVGDGKSALEFLETEMPDLVILDVILPDIDGYEICRRIRRDKQFDQMPVLFHTKLEDIADMAIGLEMGFADFTTKNCDMRELQCRIEGLLHTKKMMKQEIDFSVIDEETNVYSRIYFLHRLHDEFERSRRYMSRFSFAVIGIDGFRKANAVYEAAVCFQILNKIAEIVRRNVRRADILCRYDFGEFGWMLPETRSEEAFAALERLRENVLVAEVGKGKCRQNFTVSSGISSFTRQLNSVEDLILQAEQAFSNAREGVGNRTVIFQP